MQCSVARNAQQAALKTHLRSTVSFASMGGTTSSTLSYISAAAKCSSQSEDLEAPTETVETAWVPLPSGPTARRDQSQWDA
jgi:hypothetical protein